MVFQDYELIQTKRVARQRRAMNIHHRRLWNAFGGWNSLYFGGVAGFMGLHFSGLGLSQALPSRQIFSRAGFVNYMKVGGLKFMLPVASGMAMGVIIFGDKYEFSKLIRLDDTYRNELEEYKKELFYS
jgi:hypothetical protein